MQELNLQPVEIPVLFGDPKSPYWRLDPYFMEPPEDEREARNALNLLIKVINEKLKEVVVCPGEIFSVITIELFMVDLLFLQIMMVGIDG